MTIHEERDGTSLTVIPEGSLDTLSSPELERFLKARYDEVRHIVFDLKDLEYISSAGLRLLIQAYKAMKDKDGVQLINVNSEQVRDLFSLTGYSHVLKTDRSADFQGGT